MIAWHTKEADGCAILKRVAMMKTELRRVFSSRVWPKYYENMAQKTTNTTEKEGADDGRERRPEENLPLTLL
ncbi:hypothetical protein T12_1976 [Trichinella patagoniensis]|uniref:Uncharacterized protein n=1 Tax=Trichinella patagoniensis TaxID=990121 RepID=A0A0V0YZ87_9BILA|nr:hypothetical protein T12_6023 [Trichinella patagoniensis]KRY05470.1 hypothetical protein T12_1976 [Trichinella patagoniensis]